MFILSGRERCYSVELREEKIFLQIHLQITYKFRLTGSSMYEQYEQYEQDQISAIHRRKMLTHLKSFKTLGSSVVGV